MRVNHQNIFRLISFCICLMLMTFAFKGYAQDTDVEVLMKQAEQGDPSSQYFLGLLYKEGELVHKNQMLAYVWLSLAAKQNFSDAERQKEKVYADIPRVQRPTVKVIVDQYYKKFVVPFIPPFVINVNGIEVTKSSEISPEIPIYVLFTHTNPKVTSVRMRQLGKKRYVKTYELGRPHSVINHEAYMKAGRVSKSVFLAIDGEGRIYDQITISFKPAGEQKAGEQNNENSQ